MFRLSSGVPRSVIRRLPQPPASKSYLLRGVKWRLVQHTDGPKTKGVPNARRENIFRNSLLWIRRRIRCWDRGRVYSSGPARRFCTVVSRNVCRDVFTRQLSLAASREGVVQAPSAFRFFSTAPFGPAFFDGRRPALALPRKAPAD